MYEALRMGGWAVALALLGGPLWSQGISSGNARPAPKGKFSGKPWPVSFVDVAATVGLDMKFTSGNEARKNYVIEANGSGVAFLDYDGDGRLDVFLVNGSRLGATAPATPNRLYRNAGGGKFTDVTKAAGVAAAGWGNGVCSGDFNNDGHADLYVTYWGKNLLYRNRGDGGFVEMAGSAGVAGSGEEWSTGCTFVDYDRDGQLDLLVATYLEFRLPTTPLPGKHPWCMWKGSPVFCGPRGLPHGRLTLYRNRGDGSFEDVSVKAGVRAVSGCYGFTTVAADFDQDGWPDVYVACDSTPSILLRNRKDGTFQDIGTESGLAFSDNGAEQAGMGIGLGDFDNDGRLDVMKTNFTGDYPNLYRNQGRGIFQDLSMKAGLGVNPDFVLWGAAFADFDNDGWTDILHVSGHVYPEVAKIDARESYQTPRLVYRNLGGGRFEDVSSLSGAAVAAKYSSRGAAFGDFDNDGDVDVLVMNMHSAVSLLRNDVAGGRWVKLRLEGVKSNRMAVGATVVVHYGSARQAAAVVSQTSFLSVNDPRLHFGLGAADKVDRITVSWPTGESEEFGAVEAGGLYLLKEGSGRAERLELPR